MKNVYFLLTVGFIFFQSACAPTFYAPNRLSMPVLKKKNDIRFSIAKGFLGLETQIAYSPWNNIGLLLNYANYLKTADKDGFKEGDGNGIEVGGGFYKKISYFSWENYFLIGRGGFYNRAKFISPFNPEDDGNLDAKFQRLAVQSCISYPSKYFTISSGVRFSHLKYHNIVGNYHEVSENLGNQLRNSPSFNLIEPGLNLRLGIKYVKFDIQYLKSFNIGQNKLYFIDTNYSVGLQFSLTD